MKNRCTHKQGSFSDTLGRYRTVSALLWVTTIVLISISQVNYVTGRLEFLRHLFRYGILSDQAAKQRQAFLPADYDLLNWVAAQTAPDSVLLLVTPTIKLPENNPYVLYHRALVHLYPRKIIWITQATDPKPHPAWWIESSLTETDLHRKIVEYQADTVLVEGMPEAPLTGEVRSYDENTFLIFVAN